MITSNNSITVQMTGDVTYSQVFPAATNTATAGQNDLVLLTTGTNTITVTTGDTAITIIKPTTNTNQIRIGSSTGLALGLTDPDKISLNAVTAVVLYAAAPVTVRVITT